MRTNTREKYVETRDENGDDYICPLGDAEGDSGAAGITYDDCIEKDVLERYSGNIDIVGRDG